MFLGSRDREIAFTPGPRRGKKACGAAEASGEFVCCQLPQHNAKISFPCCSESAAPGYRLHERERHEPLGFQPCLGGKIYLPPTHARSPRGKLWSVLTAKHSTRPHPWLLPGGICSHTLPALVQE